MNRETLHRAVDHLWELQHLLRSRNANGVSEASEHFRRAKRESLLGIRAIVDMAIDHLDQERTKQTNRRKGKKITIEE